jgi:hypothetical protein
MKRRDVGIHKAQLKNGRRRRSRQSSQALKHRDSVKATKGMESTSLEMTDCLREAHFCRPDRASGGGREEGRVGVAQLFKP